jgi:hypothetical protein
MTKIFVEFEYIEGYDKPYVKFSKTQDQDVVCFFNGIDVKIEREEE